jgi:hypothetical protein
MIEEVNLIPELTAARAQTTDPHGEEKPHRSTGRDLRREHCRWSESSLNLKSRSPLSRSGYSHKRSFSHTFHADTAGCGIPGLRMLQNSYAKPKGPNHRFRTLADRVDAGPNDSRLLGLSTLAD